MDNQHQKITGYRDLTQAEIDLMNEVKALGELVGACTVKLRTLQFSIGPTNAPDPRWVSIGEIHLQQGFMALTRSIAKPTTF